MINLLPQPERESIVYARRNSKLLRWSGVMALSIFIMVLLWGTGYLYIASTTTKLQGTIARKQSDLQAQKLDETQNRISDLSNNLKLILQVLSKEVLFSKLLQQIGSVMPSGSVLSTIEISKVEGGLDLIALAKNHQTATQVQLNLQDPRNKLFDKVDLVSVNCGPATVTTPNTSGSSAGQGVATQTGTKVNPYPCTVNLRALFDDENPFLFINKSSDGAGQ